MPVLPSACIPARHASSSVVAPLLNWPRDLVALGDVVHQPPHGAPPKAPVLYLRPRNTWVGEGAAVVVPAGADTLRVGASIGAVIGQVACAVPADRALAVVAGWVVIDDLSIAHQSFYRPALPQRCRDGFCVISAAATVDAISDPDSLAWRVTIDGKPAAEGSTAGAVRPFARLVADVTAFMTLHPGDVLLLGAANDGPLAHAGQTVQIEFGGLPMLTHRLVAEAHDR